MIDLNEFDIFAKKQGINFVYTFPSYCEGGFEKNMIVIQKIEQQVREKAKFNVIGTSQSSVLDDTLFFNNEYNLNSEGRKIFTSRLLQLLEQEGIWRFFHTDFLVDTVDKMGTASDSPETDISVSAVYKYYNLFIFSSETIL